MGLNNNYCDREAEDGLLKAEPPGINKQALPFTAAH
jgi:hypothetical protein